jgi:hypothetical protein
VNDLSTILSSDALFTTAGEKWMEDQTLESAKPQDALPVVDSVDIPLSAQRWNSFVFILNNSITYFVAPVFYVGLLHAAILSSLGYSDAIANLPEAVFGWMLVTPILIAWIFQGAHLLKRILVINYLCKVLAGIAAAVLFYVAPKWLPVAIVAHAGVVGATSGITNMCLWEVIGSGMTSARRSWTLAMTFGFGPLFALLGATASDMILRGYELAPGFRIGPLEPPLSYAVLFGATVPAMLLAAASALLVRVPETASVETSANKSDFRRGLRQYLTYRLILVAACGFLLTNAGSMIMNNVGLLSKEVLGGPAEKYTGLQFQIRFGCKSLLGFALGWFAIRFHAKGAALVTTIISLAGALWALFVPGPWYLLSMGLLGAGELHYIYYMNYIVASSPTERIRENTAYTNALTSIASTMTLVYGVTSDRYGLRSSLCVAAAIMLAGVIIVTVFLPRQPHPPGSSVDRAN